MKIKFGDNSLNLKVDGSLANIDRGPRGYSAYEIAVQEGFVGTEEEWLASLVGPEGKQGKDGERGIQGPRGQQGDKGEKGDTGQQGDKGEKGDTGPQGEKGDTGATGPQGDKGEKGDTGPSNVLSIGSVTKGDEANATITGESPNQILNLVLPKGDKGEKGEKGDTGPQGETGATGNGILSIQKTSTAGLVDTYTTTFTNGTTTTFDVTNGEDGEVTQAQLDETNENVSWLQTLTDQMPHVAGQGTDLSLQSVLNYRLMKFLPQGVSSQDGEPTPSTPIPVKSVTGENSVVLQNENLFDVNDITRGYELQPDGRTNVKPDWYVSDYIKVTPNTNYYLSGTKTSGQTNNFYDINKNVISYVNKLTGLLTTPSNCYYVRFNGLSTQLSDISFVKGSTAPTTYVPHEEQNYQISLGNIELNSTPDGTIRDYIYGTPDNWYKREYIGKYTFTGNEDFSLRNTNENGISTYRLAVGDIFTYKRNATDLNKAICTHYTNLETVGNITSMYSKDVGFSFYYSSQNVAYTLFINSKIGVLETFKTSVVNNVIYYPRTEYTDIPITDTTLIAQLNNIYNNAHSYNGTTNITTTYASGNEQMYLDIEALAKGGSTTTETDPIFSASASSGITSSDISNWNNKADVEDIPDLTEYVKDTNYAGSTKGGVIRINGNLGLSIDTSNGNLKTSVKTYAQYNSMTNSGFVGKGTLENVITGKNLADKDYVDTAIANAITNTLGGNF